MVFPQTKNIIKISSYCTIRGGVFSKASHYLDIRANLVQPGRGKQPKLNYGFIKYLSVLSAVTTTDASSSPAALTPKKDYVYETKEEAKQAFKELLKEKVITNFIYVECIALTVPNYSS